MTQKTLFHAKGARNNPLSDAAKELNRVKSSIRAVLEDVFGCMSVSMGGKLTRKIGLERNDAMWGLKNHPFIFLLYLQLSSHIVLVHYSPDEGHIDRAIYQRLR